eukprot:g7552.t1
MEPPRTQQVFTVTRPDSVAGVPACVCPLVRQVADHPGTGPGLFRSTPSPARVSRSEATKPQENSRFATAQGSEKSVRLEATSFSTGEASQRAQYLSPHGAAKAGLVQVLMASHSYFSDVLQLTPLVDKLAACGDSLI